MRKILAGAATAALLAVGFVPPASGAGVIYVYHGKDVAWSKSGARAVGVMDKECDGASRVAWVHYQLRDGTSGKLKDRDGCSGEGRARTGLRSQVWKIRVCEGDGTANCSRWKLITR